MPSFDIEVTRDGGWWAVHIPELGGLTQARYPSEVEPMARVHRRQYRKVRRPSGHQLASLHTSTPVT
jgi:hypothetical protein